MVWKKRIFGPGPERLTNIFLNELQVEIENTVDNIKYWSPGVIVGCDINDEISFQEDRIYGSLYVGPGAVLSDGRCHIFNETQELQVNIDTSQNSDSVYYVYVNELGKLSVSTDTWADHRLENPQGSGVQPSYCHLVYLDTEVRDIRRFFQAKPNDACLLVGDLASGADFQHLYQAINYIELCRETGRDVSKKIRVVTDQVIEGTLNITVDGIEINGKFENSKNLPTLVWAYDSSENMIDLNGTEGFVIKGFNVDKNYRGNESEAVDAGSIIYNAGNNTSVFDCTVKNNNNVKMKYLVENSSSSAVVENIEIVGCTVENCYGVVSSSAGFKNSVIKNSKISGIPEHSGQAVINLGSDESAENNRVENNQIELCSVGVRLGKNCKVKGNKLVDVRWQGITVYSSGDNGNQNTVVEDNQISLDDTDSTNNEHAGICLYESGCTVKDNRIHLNRKNAIGICGPNIWSIVSHANAGDYSLMEEEFLSPCIGNHVVTGNYIESGETDIPNPAGGYGILLPSSGNVIKDNTVKNVPLGILAMDHSSIVGNRVDISWLGIVAFRECQIQGNQIWWYRDNAGVSTIPNMLFDGTPVISGILATRQNEISNNHVYGVCSDNTRGKDVLSEVVGDLGGNSLTAKMFMTDRSNMPRVDKLVRLSQELDDAPDAAGVEAALLNAKGIIHVPPTWWLKMVWSGSSNPTFDVVSGDVIKVVDDTNTSRFFEFTMLESGTFSGETNSIDSFLIQAPAGGESIESFTQASVYKNAVLCGTTTDLVVVSDYTDNSTSPWEPGAWVSTLFSGIAKTNRDDLPRAYQWGAITIACLPHLVHLAFGHSRSSLISAPAMPFSNIVKGNSVDCFDSQNVLDDIEGSTQWHSGILLHYLGDGNILSENSINGGLVGINNDAEKTTISNCVIENTSLVGVIGSHMCDNAKMSGGAISGRGIRGLPKENQIFAALVTGDGWNVSDMDLAGQYPIAVWAKGENVSIKACRIENMNPNISGPGIYWMSDGNCVENEFCTYNAVDKEWLRLHYSDALSRVGWLDDAPSSVPFPWAAVWRHGSAGSVLVAANQMGFSWPCFYLGALSNDTGFPILTPVWNMGPNDDVAIDYKNTVDWTTIWFWSVEKVWDWIDGETYKSLMAAHITG